jgi:hypothetical protein
VDEWEITTASSKQSILSKRKRESADMGYKVRHECMWETETGFVIMV